MNILISTVYNSITMDMVKYSVITLTVLFAGLSAWGQESTNSSIAKGLELFVFPAEDQDQATQDSDEIACYKWAMEQTAYDPINPPEIQAEQVDRSADGTAVKSAARGAAAGAAIGAIAGDAGTGAAVGAAAGGMRGRRTKVAGDEQEQQQNNAAAEAKEKESLEGFKKAFSACMEGKGYTVK
jgi:hypothetical protein